MAGRAPPQSIYFLLPAGVVSAWHRVGAVEIWHHYAGAPLTLSNGEGKQDIILDPNILTGQATAGRGAGGRLAIGGVAGKLDVGGEHRGAGLRVLRLRNGHGRLGVGLRRGLSLEG